jgi:geranylgeranyl diphosphate synthase type II
MFDDREILKLVNDSIESAPFDGHPRELYEPLDYILALGGKRIRPVMLLMVTDMYCGNLRRAMPAAIGIELFHNFSLIHDDIMDNAPIRRGQPTVHVKWNPNAAILSGDTMLVKAYEHFLKLPDPILKPALEMFNQTALEVCEGQQMDMNFEKQSSVSIDEYLEMIRLKTAVLIGASLYLGGLAANAPQQDLNNLYHFGIHTGIAFQLRDDLLDTYGDEKLFGKRQYGDIRANKKTYLYLKALELSDEPSRKKLAILFETPDIDPEEKVSETLSAFNKANVKELTEEKIRDHHRLALGYFDSLVTEPGRKAVILQYTDLLAGRTL